MEKTKNIYSYPIKNAKMLYKASPAHKGGKIRSYDKHGNYIEPS